jgi:hypothetical protein
VIKLPHFDAAEWPPCKANGYAVSATVVGRNGEIIVQVRGDNTGPHTIENSMRMVSEGLSKPRRSLGISDERKGWEGVKSSMICHFAAPCSARHPRQLRGGPSFLI